jgi:hypothetical protein
MNRAMRAALTLLVVLGTVSSTAVGANAQTDSGPTKDDTKYRVIDTVPAPRGVPPTPSAGVVLQRPGGVLIYGTPVNVRFQSPTDGISFHLRTGGSYSSISGVSFGVGWSGGYGWGGYGFGYGAAPYYGEVVTKAYQPICETPCDAKLLSGRHRFALSLEGNRPIEAPQPVDLTADSVVEGRYVDKSRIRKAGWAVFAAGAVSGLALMFASVNYNYDPRFGQQIRYPPMFYTGLGLFLGSIITGSVLASQDDEAHVNVYPMK